MISRRRLLAGSAVIFATAGTTYYNITRRNSATSGELDGYEIIRTPEEWQKRLTQAQFAVLRNEGTERSGTSLLLNEKRTGTFHCVACELPTYRSETKFESGTGWPSFYAAIEGAVLTKADYKAFLPRTEVHCRRCGSHFGHIFNDG
ncbi:MAG: peptide-methionine (R)-S-oxide reductase, partial [Blastopirellula sp.]